MAGSLCLALGLTFGFVRWHWGLGAAPAHISLHLSAMSSPGWRDLGSLPGGMLCSRTVLSVLWHFICKVKSAPEWFLPDCCDGLNRFILNIWNYHTKISSVEDVHWKPSLEFWFYLSGAVKEALKLCCFGQNKYIEQPPQACLEYPLTTLLTIYKYLPLTASQVFQI